MRSRLWERRKEMAQEQSVRLSKNQIIQELIALLNQNRQRVAANAVLEMAALIVIVSWNVQELAGGSYKKLIG